MLPTRTACKSQLRGTGPLRARSTCIVNQMRSPVQLKQLMTSIRRWHLETQGCMPQFDGRSRPWVCACASTPHSMVLRSMTAPHSWNRFLRV